MAEGRSEIDALRQPDGALDRAAVRRILPYGDDFLFVDRVSRLTPEEVEASFTIPEESAYLRSHFVDMALMPGVLIGEGLAQAGSMIVRYNLSTPQTHHILGLEIEHARFYSPAQARETLTYRVRLATSSRRAARLEGEVRVRERKVCRAKLVVAVLPRATLRKRLEGQSSGD